MPVQRIWNIYWFHSYPGINGYRDICSAWSVYHGLHASCLCQILNMLAYSDTLALSSVYSSPSSCFYIIPYYIIIFSIIPHSILIWYIFHGVLLWDLGLSWISTHCHIAVSFSPRIGWWGTRRGVMVPPLLDSSGRSLAVHIQCKPFAPL